MNRLKKYSALLFLITVLLTIIFINLSCDDNPVTPNEPPPGRSDYIVTVDTIDRNYTVHRTIWGTSENNMWAGGSGSENIWHYDGNSWESLHPLLGSINSIYGFAENDIYASATEGRIYHFDGSSWNEHFRYGPDGYNYYFADIWGYSSKDLYACGHYYENNKSYGMIFFYDGSDWSRLNIPQTEGQIRRIRGDFINREKQYFILNNVDLTLPDSSRIFELDGEKIKEIYYGEFYTEEASAPLIETINERIYFGFNRKIHSFDGSRFIVQKTINESNYYNGFVGRTLNDLILVASGGLAHFNGYDIKQLYQNSNTLAVFDFVVTDSSFFAVAHDYDDRVNLVIKGLLNNKME